MISIPDQPVVYGPSDEEKRRELSGHINSLDHSTQQSKIVQNDFERLWNAGYTYCLQVATTPGSMAGKFNYKESQPLHKELLTDIIRDGECVHHIVILNKSNIAHNVILSDGFSDTDIWDLEPN